MRISPRPLPSILRMQQAVWPRGRERDEKKRGKSSSQNDEQNESLERLEAVSCSAFPQETANAQKFNESPPENAGPRT